MANKPVKRITLDKKGKRTDSSRSQHAEMTEKKNASKNGKKNSGEKSSKKNVLKNAAKPAVSSGQYFKGSWNELRQVRWPNRRATWSLTAAVLLYSAFFTVIILLLDAGFQLLFKEVILK
jgi:preprotein translocase subunit SecE